MKRIIFITGASGLLGKALIQLLDDRATTIIIGARNKPTDLLGHYAWQYFDLDDSNDDLNLKGVNLIIHLASNTKNLSASSDITGTQTLLTMARRDQVKHLIYVSIVGIDTIPTKYYKTKKKVEELIRKSNMGYSILRSTQFLEFAEFILDKITKRPVVFIPNLYCQPIATSVVAQKIIELSQAEPLNDTVAIGGSEVLTLKSAVRQYLRYKNENKPVLTIPTFMLGSMGKALTTAEKAAGSMTWSEYLKSKSEHDRAVERP